MCIKKIIKSFKKSKYVPNVEELHSKNDDTKSNKNFAGSDGFLGSDDKSVLSRSVDNIVKGISIVSSIPASIIDSKKNKNSTSKNHEDSSNDQNVEILGETDKIYVNDENKSSILGEPQSIYYEDNDIKKCVSEDRKKSKVSYIINEIEDEIVFFDYNPKIGLVPIIFYSDPVNEIAEEKPEKKSFLVQNQEKANKDFIQTVKKSLAEDEKLQREIEKELEGIKEDLEDIITEEDLDEKKKKLKDFEEKIEILKQKYYRLLLIRNVNVDTIYDVDSRDLDMYKKYIDQIGFSDRDEELGVLNDTTELLDFLVKVDALAMDIDEDIKVKEDYLEKRKKEYQNANSIQEQVSYMNEKFLVAIEQQEKLYRSYCNDVGIVNLDTVIDKRLAFNFDKFFTDILLMNAGNQMNNPAGNVVAGFAFGRAISNFFSMFKIEEHQRTIVDFKDYDSIITNGLFDLRMILDDLGDNVRSVDALSDKLKEKYPKELAEIYEFQQLYSKLQKIKTELLKKEEETKVMIENLEMSKKLNNDGKVRARKAG